MNSYKIISRIFLIFSVIPGAWFACGVFLGLFGMTLESATVFAIFCDKIDVFIWLFTVGCLGCLLTYRNEKTFDSF